MIFLLKLLRDYLLIFARSWAFASIIGSCGVFASIIAAPIPENTAPIEAPVVAPDIIGTRRLSMRTGEICIQRIPGNLVRILEAEISEFAQLSGNYFLTIKLTLQLGC